MHNKKEKSVTVCVPETVTSTSCNKQVLHMCMVRTYHTNAPHNFVHMLHMLTTVHKRNALTLTCVTYAYNCTHTYAYAYVCVQL